MTTVHLQQRGGRMSDWRDRAGCIGLDTSLFFPDSATKPTEALEVCSTCPVRVDCLLDAIDRPKDEDHGIRGGTSRAQRKRIRRLLHRDEAEVGRQRGAAGTAARRVSAVRRSRTLKARDCVWCWLPFTPKAPNQLHCSMACADARRRDRMTSDRRSA